MEGFIDYIKKRYYISFVVLTNALAFVCLGGALSWASPSMVKLHSKNSPIPMDSSQISWAGSLLAIGAVSVAIPYTFMFMKVGRRLIIVVISILYISGWLVMIFANSVMHVYIARFLLGAAVGPTYGTVPAYLAEVIGKTRRGSTVAIIIVSQSVGALMQYLIGPLVSFQSNNNISIFFPMALLLCSSLIPESPYYLIGTKQLEEAEYVLSKLRAACESTEVKEEFEDIKKCVQETPRMSYKDLLKELPLTKTKKMFIIIAVATFTQQFSGVGAVVVYMETIFKEMKSPIEPRNAVLLAEILSDITLLITLFIIDRISRKALLAISGTVCFLAHFLVGLFFYLRGIGILVDGNEWIGVFGILLLQIGFAIGLGSVPILIMSEVMSYSIKGWLSAFYQLIQGTYNAISIKFYQISTDEIGQYVPHWVFAACIFMSVSFLLCFAPETRNKSLREIQDILSETERPKTTDNNTVETVT